MTEEDVKLHWEDLSDKQKVALVEMADGRVFWNDLWVRTGRLKSVATFIAVASTAWYILKDALAAFIKGLIGG